MPERCDNNAKTGPRRRRGKVNPVTGHPSKGKKKAAVRHGGGGKREELG